MKLLNKVKDYSFSEDYSIIAQLKSWVSINPHFGCIWDCAYCLQEKDEWYAKRKEKIVKKYSIEYIINKIVNNPKITSKTPLTFFNFSDPFLSQNIKPLLRILKELDERRFKNPIGLITKTYVPNYVLQEISNLINLKPLIIVTYAGYADERIESAPGELRVKLIKESKKNNLVTLLYLRPLVKEWITEGQLERVYDETKNYIDGLIMSGLRITPEIIKKIKEKGLTIPYTPNYKNKYFPEDLQNKVLEVFKDVAVFRYTSCAVSAMYKIPDYNNHIAKYNYKNNTNITKCFYPCIKNQKERCFNVEIPNDKKIQKILDVFNVKIDYKIKNGIMYINKNLSKEDMTYIRHNTNMWVVYDKKGKIIR